MSSHGINPFFQRSESHSHMGVPEGAPSAESTFNFLTDVHSTGGVHTNLIFKFRGWEERTYELVQRFSEFLPNTYVYVLGYTNSYLCQFWTYFWQRIHIIGQFREKFVPTWTLLTPNQIICAFGNRIFTWDEDHSDLQCAPYADSTF